MGWFKKKEEERWDELQTYLKNSFTNVKQDTSNIFDWLQFLYQKSTQQEQMINQLQYQLNQTPNSSEAIRSLIDQHYAYSNVHGKIKELHQKLALLSQTHDSHNTRINQLHEKFENIQELQKPQKQPNIKERIIQKLTSNSKNYVKTVILSFIEKYHKISALQLKEMLVDEQKLCSKSSFYRLLQELETEKRVDLLSDGKNKLYMAKNPYIHQ